MTQLLLHFKHVIKI